MPLETCMILLDCSEHMRNGDYIPNRLEAQRDAANLLTSVKQHSHPESTVGIAAGLDVLASPTRNMATILSSIHETDFPNGRASNTADSSSLTAAVQVASLALKHRTNKHGGQRIVVFCGTPIADADKALTKTGKQLKKNNIAIDVVLLGEQEANEPKAELLTNAANGTADGGGPTCHVVPIPAGVLPSDVLASSPVCAADGGAHMAAAVAAAPNNAGGGDGFDFGGVDPNMDPELAMALRVSMEEERARQERAAAAAASEAPDESGGGGEDSPAAAAASAGVELSDEEALLQQALAMSMNDDEEEAAAASGGNSEAADVAMAESGAAGGGDDDMDEDAAMQMALQMSMQEESNEGDKKAEDK